MNSWFIDAATNNIHNNPKKKKYPMWLKTGQITSLVRLSLKKLMTPTYYIYTYIWVTVHQFELGIFFYYQWWEIMKNVLPDYYWEYM